MRFYDPGHVEIGDADTLLQYINGTTIHADHPGAISIAEDQSGGMNFDSDALTDLDLMFVQYMQDTCAADSFRRGPHQDNCVARPRMFATRILKSAVKLDNRLAILPDRYGSA